MDLENPMYNIPETKSSSPTKVKIEVTPSTPPVVQMNVKSVKKPTVVAKKKVETGMVRVQSRHFNQIELTTDVVNVEGKKVVIAFAAYETKELTKEEWESRRVQRMAAKKLLHKIG